MADVKTLYQIVCLCGSTRFKDYFLRLAASLELAGKIVLMPSNWKHADNLDLSEDQIHKLNTLHLEKIRIADRVIIVNVGHYVGIETQNEINFALTLKKPVSFITQMGTGDNGK